MRAEFTINASWCLLIHCPSCDRVTATWSAPTSTFFQQSLCVPCWAPSWDGAGFRHVVNT